MFKKSNVNKFIKDWKFWFKLATMILIFVAIIWDLVVNISNPAKEWIYEYKPENNEGEPTIIYNSTGAALSYLSFFTVQSNLLVAFWLMISLIKQEGDHKLLTTKVSIFVATYITITMLIFNLVLLPELCISEPKTSDIHPSNWKGTTWFKQMTLHLVGPLLFIFYILFFMKTDEAKGTKEFLKNDSLKVMYYPIVYGIYILIRAEIRIAMGMPTTGTSTYPYFFMNLRESWYFFIMIVFILIGLCIGLSTLYNLIISKRINQKQT
ncbi:hypothetical protein STIUS_v1c02210 [Spiroplasma sp. TIUS-1]|uniref:DUF1600 domain-containing protein n=1 Tax=Spiroplasma sp. TIUS-1 TaxID=216963 RepID=UPI0013976462|nr:DUF1600 domain-containing protein [Spiroplasma sp. TIUS-1]QHX35776.1 hypothetical protein STIUS_v1c02210 [Spiroplasma sp. TIUS-1]